MLSPLDVPTSPFSLDAGSSREVQYFAAVGRVDRRKTVVEAREQLKSIGARLAGEFAKTNAGETLDGRPLADTMVADVRTALFVLMGAVGFVLLIAIANVGNLLLARGEGCSTISPPPGTSMAENFWPGADPIGKRVTFETASDSGPPVYRTVVGVAKNVRQPHRAAG